MKKYPFPNKNLKTLPEVKEHFVELVSNAMNWLMVDGYTWFVLMPDDENHHKDDTAGACIVVEYPYKKFHISIQQSEIDKCLAQKKDSPFWKNLELMMVHEVIHIILWRLEHLAYKRHVTEQDIRDENEAVVDHLANIVHTAMMEVRKNKS